MKQKIMLPWLLLAALCAVIIVYSCHKKDASPPALSASLSLADAKKYYNKLKAEQGDQVTTSNKSASAPGKTNRKYPLFKLAYVSENADYTFVEAPLRYNSRPSLQIAPKEAAPAGSRATNLERLSASFDRLLIYKNKQTGAINQRIVTFIPDEAYLKRHNNDVSGNHINKLDADFDGYLAYHDWKGQLLFTIKIRNGKPAGLHTFNGVKKAKPAAPANRMVCIEYTVTNWQMDCWVFDAEEPIEVCGDWYIVSQYTYQECTDDGTGDPDCYETGTCGEGGGGGGENPPQPPAEDPCSNATSQTANATYNSKVTDLKSQTSGALEHGWFNTQNPDGSYSYKAVNADPGTPAEIGIDLTSSSPLIQDFMHSHFTGYCSTFDGDDVYAIYQIFSAGKMADANTFNTTVATPNGVYMLSIGDMTKFQNYAPNAAANTLGYLLAFYGFDKTASAATNEIALVRVLESANTGLTLMRQDPAGQFQRLSYNSNNSQIQSTNCN
jgi:hypothetical protein